jgi:hypothetical protein
MYNTIQQELQQAALMRLPAIVGDKAAGTPGVFPVSRSSFLAGVKSGKYPKPIRVGRSVAWRQKDILDLLKSLGDSE